MQELVKCYQVRAVSAAFLIVRDSKLAEDLVQDAFLHVAEKIDQFNEDRPFEPWFLRRVINGSTLSYERVKELAEDLILVSK